MRLGLSLSLARTGGGGPAPYATYTSVGAKSVDNGWYEVYVEPNNGSDGWSTLKTRTGSVTIAKAASQASMTRARLFGPYRLTPTADAVGSTLQVGAIFNSTGATGTCTDALAIVSRMTAASQGANVTTNHQGFCTDGTYWYVFDTGKVQRRSRDVNWTLVNENLTPYTGLPVVSPAINHCGDGDYYNGKLYAPFEYWNGSNAASGQCIALMDPATLTVTSYFDISSTMIAQDAGGCCIDAAAGLIIVSSYTDATRLYCFDLATGAARGVIPLVGSGYFQFQGVTIKNNLLYVSGQRNDTSGQRVVLVFSRQGELQQELNLDADYGTTKTIEGLCFDGASLGVWSDIVGTSLANFYTLPTIACKTQSGFLAAKDVALIFAGRQLGADFTILTEMVPTTLFDFNEVWDNTLAGDDFESWTPANGNVRARAQQAGTATYLGPITAGATLVMGYSYTRSTGVRALYANGLDRVTGTETAGKVWPAGGAHGLAGVSTTNNLGDHRFRWHYIFSRTLTEGEKQAIETDPFSVWTPTNALTAADKARVATS